MKDFSSYGYMQGPIRVMAREDLNTMGIGMGPMGNKRRSKTQHSVTNMHQVTQPGPHDKSIYGKPLNELETRPVPGQPYIRVPRLLLRSCNFLSHHLNTEGLFRKSGSVARQKLIRMSLNEGHSIDEDANPHDVANLLKQFLRELPEPLVTYDLYDAFLQTQLLNLEEDKIQAMLLLSLHLPDINRHTLQFLVQFLQTVSENNTRNRMTVVNIAVVTAPNVIRSPTGDCSKIKVETVLMECFVQNATELGLVPEDIAHRAHKMILELSGMWGVSAQEAAVKIPIKGKRKRSGSLSGILTSVFKTSKAPTLRTTKRKSFSNQDLTDIKMKSQPIHGDLSFSTPCIIKTPGPATRLLLNTPLLTAKRRTALLRQTPVDPRKKPKTLGPSDNECESPMDMDPPTKRTKLDISPQTEPVNKKRKNFKQRLSEGLSSRYRKSRFKRKRIRDSLTSDTPMISSAVHNVDMGKKKKDRTPVFCFKAKPGSFNDQHRRLSNNKDVVVNHCTRYLESPVQPELITYSPAVSNLSLESTGLCTPGQTHKSLHKTGKKLFPSPKVESDDEVEMTCNERPVISPEVQLRRNHSYLQSCHDVDLGMEDMSLKSKEAKLVKRSPRLRRSAPVTSALLQVPHAPRLSDPGRSGAGVQLRRSPRLMGERPQFPELLPKFRTVSGGSYTAARHSVTLGTLDATDKSPLNLTSISADNVVLTNADPYETGSLNSSINMSAALITPQTFSRVSRTSRSSERHQIVKQMEITGKQQPFSPIRMSLTNITPAGSNPCLNPTSSNPQQPPYNPESSSASCSLNLTELFTSRDITMLDVSLNVSEFDKNFFKQTRNEENEEVKSGVTQCLDTSIDDLCRQSGSQTSDSSNLISCDQNTHLILDTDNPTEIFSANLEASTKEAKFGMSENVWSTDPSVTVDITRTSAEDSVSESRDQSRVSACDDSHITYITQNMSSFFTNNTVVHNDSGHMDYPKFEHRMPSFAQTVISPPETVRRSPFVPSLIDSCSTKEITFQFDASQISEFSGNATEIKKQATPKPIIPEKPTIIFSEKPVIPKKPTIIPRMLNSVVVSEFVELPSPASPRNVISTLPGSLVTQSPKLPRGITPLPRPLTTSQPQTTTTTTTTPLAYAEKHRTVSKEAVVVTGRVKPDLKADVVVQDDQVSSSSQVHENVSNKENLTKTPVTPTANQEIDTTKINITPRTKISKGFTKNLANQWEKMNRDEKTTTRLTRTNTCRNAKPTLAKSASVSNRLSTDKTSKTPTKRGRHVRTPARATSARQNTRVTSTRQICRTKSEATLRTTKSKADQKPAWRF